MSIFEDVRYSYSKITDVVGRHWLREVDLAIGMQHYQQLGEESGNVIGSVDGNDICLTIEMCDEHSIDYSFLGLF